MAETNTNIFYSIGVNAARQGTNTFVTLFTSAAMGLENMLLKAPKSAPASLRQNQYDMSLSCNKTLPLCDYFVSWKVAGRCVLPGRTSELWMVVRVTA